MSSSQSQFPQPPQSASSSPKQPDAQATPPEPVPLAETSMDQHLVSTLMMDSSPASASSEETSTLDLTSEDPTDSEDTLSGSDLLIRQQPIPPASEPMQYRAIGLVKGKYTPLEEQFTRGMLVTEDGTTIDAVLLGRVMSLVKKHLDLEQSHLWVVYPRTREKDNDLHVQIVGVWEPEKLNKVSDGGDLEQSDDDTSADATEDAQASDTPEDGYFSVRGEVLFYSPDDQRLIVKIQQSPRKGAEQGKSFKLNLKGTVEGKSVGYFWDFNVRREDNLLVVQDGTMIKMVPPKKHKTKRPTRGGGRPPAGKKRWDGPREGSSRPQVGGDRPSSVTAPPVRKAPLPKPVKKSKNESNPT
ncbi:MAG TPA: hypothetical protein V6C78_23710 [Crinalium sp.]